MMRSLLPLVALMAGAVLGYRLREVEDARPGPAAVAREVRETYRADPILREVARRIEAVERDLNAHREEAGTMATTCAVPAAWLDLGVVPLTEVAARSVR